MIDILVDETTVKIYDASIQEGALVTENVDVVDVKTSKESIQYGDALLNDHIYVYTDDLSHVTSIWKGISNIARLRYPFDKTIAIPTAIHNVYTGKYNNLRGGGDPVITDYDSTHTDIDSSDIRGINKCLSCPSDIFLFRPEIGSHITYISYYEFPDDYDPSVDTLIYSPLSPTYDIEDYVGLISYYTTFYIKTEYLNDGWKWEDGTTTNKVVYWNISKNTTYDFSHLIGIGSGYDEATHERDASYSRFVKVGVLVLEMLVNEVRYDLQVLIPYITVELSDDSWLVYDDTLPYSSLKYINSIVTDQGESDIDIIVEDNPYCGPSEFHGHIEYYPGDNIFVSSPKLIPWTDLTSIIDGYISDHYDTYDTFTKFGNYALYLDVYHVNPDRLIYIDTALSVHTSNTSYNHIDHDPGSPIAANNGTYLIYSSFMNTYSMSDASAYIVAVNSSLTASNHNILSRAKHKCGEGNTDNYVLILGGRDTSSNKLLDVDAINRSLSKTSATALPSTDPGYDYYAIYFNGDCILPNTYSSTVKYNNSLTQTILTDKISVNDAIKYGVVGTDSLGHPVIYYVSGSVGSNVVTVTNTSYTTTEYTIPDNIPLYESRNCTLFIDDKLITFSSPLRTTDSEYQTDLGYQRYAVLNNNGFEYKINTGTPINYEFVTSSANNIYYRHVVLNNYIINNHGKVLKYVG